MESLATLPAGQTAIISDLVSGSELGRRLEALGLKVGQHICVIRRAPLSGPIQIRVGTTDVILRRREASYVRLQSVA